MDWLELELKRALAPRDPPPGFADRILGRKPGFHARRWMAAAAAVIVISSAGYGYRWRQGLEAKRQVMLAVRIVALKTSHIQAQVKELTR